jgi:S-adenosylmethionine synthetase
MSQEYIFTSESVTEGHPDKIADQISDGVLDELIRLEYELEGADPTCDSKRVPDSVKNMRCACETIVTTGTVFVCGEIRTEAYADVQSIVRNVVNDIGYNRAKFGFDGATCGVINAIHEQSPDIASGVDDAKLSSNSNDFYDKIGAGDQGSVFGYACSETDTLMPMPIYLSHRMSERLSAIRKSGTVDYLRPDGKVQVSVKYNQGKPVSVDSVVLSTQHAETVEMQDLAADMKRLVIAPVLSDNGFEIPSEDHLYINPTGRFVIGGPMGDTGLTGRKIIVDTYGGIARHGGGAYSGKDPTKVDRSASYMARYVAKNIVAAKLAQKCEVQISYAIGVSHPVSVLVETFGTSIVDPVLIEQAVRGIFDLRPAAIIDALNLWHPIYRKTTNYGHFGRELPVFEWEKCNHIEDLRTACKL